MLEGLLKSYKSLGESVLDQFEPTATVNKTLARNKATIVLCSGGIGSISSLAYVCHNNKNPTVVYVEGSFSNDTPGVSTSFQDVENKRRHSVIQIMCNVRSSSGKPLASFTPGNDSQYIVKPWINILNGREIGNHTTDSMYRFLLIIVKTIEAFRSQISGVQFVLGPLSNKQRAIINAFNPVADFCSPIEDEREALLWLHISDRYYYYYKFIGCTESQGYPGFCLGESPCSYLCSCNGEPVSFTDSVGTNNYGTEIWKTVEETEGSGSFINMLPPSSSDNSVPKHHTKTPGHTGCGSGRGKKKPVQQSVYHPRTFHPMSYSGLYRGTGVNRYSTLAFPAMCRKCVGCSNYFDAYYSLIREVQDFGFYAPGGGIQYNDATLENIPRLKNIAPFVKVYKKNYLEVLRYEIKKALRERQFVVKQQVQKDVKRNRYVHKSTGPKKGGKKTGGEDGSDASEGEDDEGFEEEDDVEDEEDREEEDEEEIVVAEDEAQDEEEALYDEAEDGGKDDEENADSEEDGAIENPEEEDEHDEEDEEDEIPYEEDEEGGENDILTEEEESDDSVDDEGSVEGKDSKPIAVEKNPPKKRPRDES